MQPDPEIFLAAIRREVTRADLFGEAARTGLAPLLMLRAAEALLQLQLRETRLPAIVEKALPRERALLAEFLSAVDAQGLPRPPSAVAASVLDRPAGPVGEGRVRLHDALTAGIADCLAVLGRAAADRAEAAADVESFGLAACRIEADVREACRSALGELRQAQSASAAAEPSALGRITDADLTRALKYLLPGYPGIEARGLQPLPGLNAQEIHCFELIGHPPLEGPMVLRRTSEYNATLAQLADEFDLLNHLHAQGLPVARVVTADRGSERLGRPFIVMERLAGRAHTAAELKAQGPDLLRELAVALARLHRVEPRQLPAPYRHTGRNVAALMRDRIERYYLRWQRERHETSMAVEAAFNWLRRNSAVLGERVSLVHGDCNLRNILIDNGRLSALLDWELAHLGHAAEDLVYLRPDVETLMPWPDFLSAYVAAGGTAPNAAELEFFGVWREAWRSALAASIAGGYLRGEHRNFIFATVGICEYFDTLDPLARCMAQLGPRTDPSI